MASHQKGRVSSEAFSVHTCCAILGFGLPESRLENMQGKNKPGNLLPYKSSSCLFGWLVFAVVFNSSFNFPPICLLEFTLKSPHIVALCILSIVFSYNQRKRERVGD